MYIAMNRFKVKIASAEAFTRRWLERDMYLQSLPGFVSFRLLRGAETADYVLFSSHTIWASQADFIAWTQSPEFKAAHARAEQAEPMTIGAPQFEGFSVLQELTAKAA
jgi:heme-degrading monooxygenase HmoA